MKMIFLVLFVLISCSKQPDCVVMNQDNEIDSLMNEIEKRNTYLRVMIDAVIRKPIPVDSILGKTIIEIGKL